jgi:N-acetyl-gamma-glutamyl-phosphate/LysW-gamma-L-alpha-aminoadipyl-6-phosphate reductase
MIRAAVVGAGGFVGGELLRLLLGHPRVEPVAATSMRSRGRHVSHVHPNLRGATDLAFSSVADLGRYDVLFSAVPHGAAMKLLPDLLDCAPVVIDLSADFRLGDAREYARWYGPHAAPHLLGRFVPGFPELHRDRLATADRIAVPGCTAAAAVLALTPLAEQHLIDTDVDVEAHVGSSGSGAALHTANLHPLRSRAMRAFAFGHRHDAEIAQATGLRTTTTATAVEAVRGVLVVCRTRPVGDLTERDLWQLYRRRYGDEPFVRVVHQRRGVYRQPEPRVLSGSNYCDVGFAVSGDRSRVFAVAAVDNLMKGAAGNALQCLNLRAGWPERLGLEFAGLQPV